MSKRGAHLGQELAGDEVERRVVERQVGDGAQLETDEAHRAAAGARVGAAAAGPAAAKSAASPIGPDA